MTGNHCAKFARKLTSSSLQIMVITIDVFASEYDNLLVAKNKLVKIKQLKNILISNDDDDDDNGEKELSREIYLQSESNPFILFLYAP